MNPVLLLAITAEAVSLALGHLTTGLAYYRGGQHEKALREFDIVLRDFADSPVADDALYWSALAWDAAGQPAKAEAARAALARRFPHSPYHAGPPSPAVVTPAPPAATPAPPVAAAPPAAAPVVSPTPPATTGATLAIRNDRGQTVAVLNGKTYRVADALAKALAELKREQPGAVVTFQRDADVDLQMVVDAINALDQAGLTYRLP
jgi:tetratricopeptide (TPR) repeat protein